jgi:diaminohydroxyphosphoribosylaminopyrimidine deaminase / 5-amino-6-(5-phosphoribosylamino)uracil reductase
MTEQYDRQMRRALALAARGPATGVNPQVGCVLVNAEGEIVAEGWHRGSGTPHAEVDALSKLVSTGSTAEGLTAIVTLEPCNHTGRTGPCSVALIEAGVARVIYSVSDPNPQAEGGASRLRAAGIPAEGGLLADNTEELLHPWLTAVRLGRPHVTVKWASSLDGRAAAADGTSQWITGTAARQHVHERRALADAIVVGTGTVLDDDPSLTARGDAGELLEHQPVPVVIGERAVPADAKLRSHPAGLIETGSRDLGAVLKDLYDRDIRRVFVEGGPTLASAFIEGGYADELLVYLAPTLIGGPKLAITDLGIATIADQRRLTITGLDRLGDDIVITARSV